MLSLAVAATSYTLPGAKPQGALPQGALPQALAAVAALTISVSPLAATTSVPANLQLSDFGSSELVSEGLQTAGMEGDLRMIKVWAQLKVGSIEAEGVKAAYIDADAHESVLKIFGQYRVETIIRCEPAFSVVRVAYRGNDAPVSLEKLMRSC